MGVCCIVFDIDGMLFEFFMNFLNIEKNKILNIFCSIFQVFFAFHAISNIKKKNGVKKKIRGGGSVDYFLTLSPAAPKARDGIYCNAPRPSVHPSVCLSVCPSRLVFALQLKNALMYFLETLQVCAPCYGGVLYSF